MQLNTYLVAAACLSGYTAVTCADPLNTIVVSTTALGQQESIEDVQATIEVLDQQTIQSISGRSVAQLLNEAAGVTVKDSGSTSSVYMRGFADAHTLLLVDGLRRTGKYGHSDLSGIQLEDIERIEIVRGPMSALYGADALAGVVNIITKKGAKKSGGSVSIIGGMAQNQDRQTGIVRASANLAGDRVSHTFAGEIRKRGDYRMDQSTIATDLRKESKKFFSYGNSIRLGDDSLQTRFEFLDQDDRGVHYTGAQTYEKENRYQASAIYNHVDDDYLIDTNVGFGYSDTDVNRGGGSETTEYTQAEFNSYFRHFTTENSTNILGVSAKREDIDVSIYTQNAERTNYSGLFQNEWEITNNLSSVAGLRYDHYSDFGSAVNPRLSAKYTRGNTDFRIGYGKAFKAPSFTNMYSHFTRSAGPAVLYDILGNPDLKPEKSKTYELAMGHRGENYSLDLVYHYSKLDDLINSYTASVTPGSFPTTPTIMNVTYGNIDQATISGTELTFTITPIEGLTVKGSVEYLDTEDKTTGDRLTDSARLTGKMHLAYLHGAMSYFLNIKTLHDYYGADATRRNVNTDYTVADLKLSYAYDRNIEIFGGIENLQNEAMPYNISLRGSPNDPGERYYYIGTNITF